MTVSERFPKDAWIKAMLRRRYLIVDPATGDIYRAAKVSDTGHPVFAELPARLDRDYRKVAVRVHRASGRVYTNITYLGVTKSVLINRVVALACHPNPLNLPQVNHIDGDKEHNWASNLEWASSSDNEKHAHRTGLKTGRGSSNSNAKLTPDSVRAIRASIEPINDIATSFGVSRSTVISIRNNRTWTHV